MDMRTQLFKGKVGLGVRFQEMAGAEPATSPLCSLGEGLGFGTCWLQIHIVVKLIAHFDLSLQRSIR